MKYLIWLCKWHLNNLKNSFQNLQHVRYITKYGLILWIRVSLLKRKAREQYQLYSSIADEWNCGDSMLQHVSYSANEAKTDYKATLNKLKKLDPEFPKNAK